MESPVRDSYLDVELTPIGGCEDRFGMGLEKILYELTELAKGRQHSWNARAGNNRYGHE